MDDTKRLLAQRNKAKKHKPPFIVNAANFQKRIERRWRLPRGLHSATRQMHKGKPAMPTPGYGSPKAVHGLTRLGVKPVVVHTVRELLAIDVSTESALLAAGIGGRSRVILLKLAVEKKIPILNVKNPTERILAIENAVKDRAAGARAKRKLKEDNKEEQQKLKQEKKTTKESAANSGAAGNAGAAVDGADRTVHKDHSGAAGSAQKKE